MKRVWNGLILSWVALAGSVMAQSGDRCSATSADLCAYHFEVQSTVFPGGCPANTIPTVFSVPYSSMAIEGTNQGLPMATNNLSGIRPQWSRAFGGNPASSISHIGLNGQIGNGESVGKAIWVIDANTYAQFDSLLQSCNDNYQELNLTRVTPCPTNPARCDAINLVVGEPAPITERPNGCLSVDSAEPSIGKAINLSRLDERKSLQCLSVGNSASTVHASLLYSRGTDYAPKWRFPYSRRIAQRLTVPLNSTTRHFQLILENGDHYLFGETADGYMPLQAANRLRLNRLASGWQITYPSGQIDLFDANGKLIEERDRSGARRVVSYSGNQATIADVHSGLGVRITYMQGLAFPTQIEELGTSRVARLTYDSARNLEVFQDVAGRTHSFSYDAQGRMTRMYDPLNPKYVNGAANPAARFTQLTYMPNAIAEVAEETQTSGARLVFRKVAGQPWNLEVEQYAPSATTPAALLRVTRDANQRVTRIYNRNSASSFTQFIYAADGNLVDAIAPNGQRTTYGYQGGFLTSLREYRDASNFDETTWQRNGFGQITSTRNAVGSVISFNYDPSTGLLLSSTRQGQVNGQNVAQTTTLSYDPVTIGGVAVTIGLPTAITLPDGTRHTFSYDNRGFPAATRLDVGAQRSNLLSTSEYDARGFLMATTDARGVRTEYEYANNPALGQFGHLGIPSAIVFDSANPDATKRRRTEYQHDAVLNPTRTVVDAGPNRINATRSAQFAVRGVEGQYLPIEITDAENRMLRLSYDALGQLSSMAQVGANNGADRTTNLNYTPEGFLASILRHGETQPFERREYDAAGLLTAVTDALGVRNNLYYDGKGRTTRVCVGVASTCATPGQSRELRFVYDALDRVLRTDVGMGGGSLRLLEERAYDGLGRLSWQRDAAGNQNSYIYDPARDFLLSATRGANAASQSQRTDFSYDRLGRILSEVVDPTGLALRTSYRYSRSGGEQVLLTEMTDPRGAVTRYEYTASGQLQAVTDALNKVTRYAYNNLDYQTKIDFPSGADTDFAVNRLGEVLSLSRAGSIESWTYNVDGSVRRHTMLSGLAVDFFYDPVGRLLRKDYCATGVPASVCGASGSDPNGLRSDVEFGYLANDLLRSQSSRPNGSALEQTLYDYDAFNRLSQRTRNGRTVGYSYNLDDTLAQLNYWGRSQVAYSYANGSGNNGWVRQATAFGTNVNYGYRATGAVEAITRNGSSVTSFGYDTGARLTRIAHSRSGAMAHEILYGLDALGNRTSIDERFPGTAPSAQSISRFTYDLIGRITRATQGAIGSSGESNHHYTYDAMGNRTSSKRFEYENTNDANNDGAPDMLWRQTAGPAVSIWFGNPNTTHSDQLVGFLPVNGTPGQPWELGATADLNGSGRTSLLWRDTQRLNAVWQLNPSDPTTPIGSEWLAELPDGNWKQEASADFDGDGKGDILWRYRSSGQMTIWYMGANGILGQGLRMAQNVVSPAGINEVLGSDWVIGGAGDFNQDGTPDIALHHTAAGALQILYLGGANGNVVIGRQEVFDTTFPDLKGQTTNWVLESVADANKDGVPDVYFRRPDGLVTIWYLGARAGNAWNSNRLGFLTVRNAAGTGFEQIPSGWEMASGSHYPRYVGSNTTSVDAQDRITSAGYAYDAAGNLSQVPGYSYSYTAANLLRSSIHAGATTEYQFDGLGHLVRSIRQGVVTDYILDERLALPVAIGEVNGNTETLYAYGPEGVFAQRRWVAGSAQGIEFLLKDGLGSVKAITDASGLIIGSTSYDLWGQPRWQQGSARSSFGFTGEQQFADGTVHLRARSYLPEIGRFLQRDTFAGFADRPQSLNRHAYVEGNPVNLTDPSGMTPCGCSGDIRPVLDTYDFLTAAGNLADSGNKLADASSGFEIGAYRLRGREAGQLFDRGMDALGNGLFPDAEGWAAPFSQPLARPVYKGYKALPVKLFPVSMAKYERFFPVSQAGIRANAARSIAKYQIAYNARGSFGVAAAAGISAAGKLMGTVGNALSVGTAALDDLAELSCGSDLIPDKTAGALFDVKAGAVLSGAGAAAFPAVFCGPGIGLCIVVSAGVGAVAGGIAGGNVRNVPGALNEASDHLPRPPRPYGGPDGPSAVRNMQKW